MMVDTNRNFVDKLGNKPGMLLQAAEKTKAALLIQKL
jgi:hypothetical protein